MKKDKLKPHSITTLDHEWAWVKKQAEKQSITGCQYVRRLIIDKMNDENTITFHISEQMAKFIELAIRDHNKLIGKETL